MKAANRKAKDEFVAAYPSLSVIPVDDFIKWIEERKKTIKTTEATDFSEYRSELLKSNVPDSVKFKNLDILTRFIKMQGRQMAERAVMR